MRKRIVVIGSSFAGLTAALGVRARLEPEHEVLVVSRSDQLVFTPSLVWLALGKRRREDIVFSVRPIFEKRGIGFREDVVAALDLPNRRLVTSGGDVAYDALVIATGAKLDWAAVPGLGPAYGYTSSIFTPVHAESAHAALEALCAAPGPVVIGAAQGASLFAPAYELLFGVARELEKRGLASRAPLTFVTPEPYVGHLGIGRFGSMRERVERLFAKHRITAVTSAAIRAVTPDVVELEGGRELPSAFTVIAPPLRGVDAVAQASEIADGAGFVRTNAFYQTHAYPEVLAAGVAVSVPQPDATRVPCGVPKTGYLAEEMGRIVAYNVAALVHDTPMMRLPPDAIDAKLVLDAGDTGLLATSDHLLEPRDHAWVLPGPEAHWAKVAFERYFLATRRRGIV